MTSILKTSSNLIKARSGKIRAGASGDPCCCVACSLPVSITRCINVQFTDAAVRSGCIQLTQYNSRTKVTYLNTSILNSGIILNFHGSTDNSTYTQCEWFADTGSSLITFENYNNTDCSGSPSSSGTCNGIFFQILKYKSTGLYTISLGFGDLISIGGNPPVIGTRGSPSIFYTQNITYCTSLFPQYYLFTDVSFASVTYGTMHLCSMNNSYYYNRGCCATGGNGLFRDYWPFNFTRLDLTNTNCIEEDI